MMDLEQQQRDLDTPLGGAEEIPQNGENVDEETAAISCSISDNDAVVVVAHGDDDGSSLCTNLSSPLEMEPSAGGGRGDSIPTADVTSAITETIGMATTAGSSASTAAEEAAATALATAVESGAILSSPETTNGTETLGQRQQQLRRAEDPSALCASVVAVPSATAVAAARGFASSPSFGRTSESGSSSSSDGENGSNTNSLSNNNETTSLEAAIRRRDHKIASEAAAAQNCGGAGSRRSSAGGGGAVDETMLPGVVEVREPLDIPMAGRATVRQHQRDRVLSPHRGGGGGDGGEGGDDPNRGDHQVLPAASASGDEGGTTLQAMAVSEEDIEQQVRDRIIRNAVQARVEETIEAVPLRDSCLEEEIRMRILDGAVEAARVETMDGFHDCGPCDGQEHIVRQRNGWRIVAVVVTAVLVIVVVSVTAAVFVHDSASATTGTTSPAANGSSDYLSDTLYGVTVTPSRLTTAAPTPQPTLSADQEVLLAFLVSRSLDNGTALVDRSSPQHSAFLWLSRDPNLDEFSTSGKLRRYGLVTLYYSTGGQDWGQNHFWLNHSAPLCQWYGLTGSSSSSCKRGQRVLRLDLANNGIRGTIPPELAYASHLKAIDLSSGMLRGNLPDPAFFDTMTDLTTLNLAANQLSSTLSRKIGSLTSLESLMLEQNQFSGVLPAELARLYNLQVLDIWDNGWSGTLPAALGGLTGLRHFDATASNVEGSIPDTWGDLAASLERLHLKDCTGLNGTFPPGLWKSTVLKDIELTNTRVGGEISTKIGSMSSLESFRVGGASFQGTIPSQIGEASRLISVVLNGQVGPISLRGQLPTSMGRLSLLQELDVSENDLSGALDGSVGDMTNLRTFAFHNNNISGTLPSTITRLTRLATLDGAHNALRGPLSLDGGPGWLGMSSLTSLDLYNNSLSGTLPSSLFSLTRLRLLKVSSNLLTGQIETAPRGLMAKSELHAMVLSWNRLSGTVPSGFGDLPAIVRLKLGQNELTGTVPPELCNTPSLEVLAADCPDKVTCPCCTTCCNSTGCFPN